MMYKIFGMAPTIKMVEWLIENQEFDHSISEIAEGAKLSVAAAKKNFDPLIQYHVVKLSRTLGSASLYVLDLQSPCTRAIVAFDEKIARCCRDDAPPSEEDTERSEFQEE